MAPDVAFGNTRLVLEPEAAWRNLASSPTTRLSRPAVLVAAAALAVVALLVVSSLFGFLKGLPAAESATPTPSPSVAPSLAASVAPSLAEVSAAGSSSVAPVVTAAPQQTTYTVQQGDTLNLIAQRFGTTAQAIADANGMKVTDTINPGQVLVIP